MAHSDQGKAGIADNTLMQYGGSTSFAKPLDTAAGAAKYSECRESTDDRDQPV
jgi:hypothetical protein